MGVFDSDVVDRRRRRAARALGDDAPLVLIGAGDPIPKPGGLDQTYSFIPHPEYYWLTGERRPGSILAYEPQAGWTHFVRPVSAEERLWEGGGEAPAGRDVAELDRWLAERKERPVALLGSAPLRLEKCGLEEDVRARLDAARRVKDEAEIALIARAVDATRAGHARAREVIRPGITERRIQIELEAEMARHGAWEPGYGSIVGAGEHAAVLHFEPRDRAVGPEEVVLVDAGASIAGYTADVTRTYPASGRFTPEQQAIYDIVLAAELEGIAACRAGTEWTEVHRRAARILADGLRDLGVLRGDVDGLLESGAIALFLPHGIGHMVGLGVRDVGGRAPGRDPKARTCGIRLRVDLPLAAGYLMTVEPGVYFVPAILDDPLGRQLHANAVHWEGLERFRAVGGVRIEDDVLVTAGDPEVLTAAIPK